jgi:23S rRNA pseudouridine1911/1915/1917 synthase
MQKEFERCVSEKMWGKRLDHYLLISGIGISRNRVHKLIKAGAVLVNDAVSKPGYTVKPGDKIQAHFELEHDLKITGEPMDIDIVYEDNEVIVVNKPVGVVVHPAKGHGHGTLVQGLLYHCCNLPEHPDSKIRPGVIHRLDKDTTGLLLFAKTDDALSLLGRAIEARKITREYLAIAWGNFPQDKGLIEAPIGRNILDRKKMAVTPFSAKTAATGFEVIERFNIATYLRLRLLTGRTHQIRVHLTHYGHPVVGDSEYGGRSKTIINQQSDVAIFKKILSIINRQALHAYKLGFNHPRTGKYVEFSVPLPEDIANLLKYLRSL